MKSGSNNIKSGSNNIKNNKNIKCLELLFQNKIISKIKKNNLEVFREWYFSVIDQYQKISLELNQKKYYQKILEIDNQKNQSQKIYPYILEKFLEKASNIKSILDNQDKNPILEFIKKNHNNNNNNHRNNNNNQSNQKVLEEFAILINHNFDEIYQLLNQVGITLSQGLSNNRFCPVEIQLEIENGFKYIYKYQGKYQESYLSLKIHSHQRLKKGQLLQILARSYFIPVYYQDSKPLIMEIYLSEHQKKKRTNDNYFGSREINSGSTGGDKITIWRKEEFLKLILHESIHYYQLDRCWDWFPELNKIKEKIDCQFQANNNQEYRIYETFTETLALILNSMIVSNNSNNNNNKKTKKRNINNRIQKKQTLKNRKNENNQWELFLEIFEYEKKFSLFQVAKILKIIGITKIEDFLIDSENNSDKCLELRNQNKDYQLIQKTSVLEYFFFKTASIIDFDKYLEYQIKKGGKEFYKTRKGIELNNINNYYKLILEVTSSKIFQKNVNYCLELLNKNNNLSRKIQNNKRCWETFRMVLF